MLAATKRRNPMTLNQIRALPKSPDAAETFARARHMQRRLKAALRSTTFPKSRLRTLASRLHAHRAGGFASDLEWFMGDYAAGIRIELKSAVKWRADTGLRSH